MENTIDSALLFIFESDPKAEEAIDNGFDLQRRYTDEEWLELMVRYASTVSPRPGTISEDDEKQIREILKETCTEEYTTKGLEVTWNWSNQAKAVCDYFRSRLSAAEVKLPEIDNPYEGDKKRLTLSDGFEQGWNAYERAFKELNGVKEVGK